MKPFHTLFFAVFFHFAKGQSKSIGIGSSNNIYGSSFNQSLNKYNTNKITNIHYDGSYKWIDIFKALTYFKSSLEAFQNKNALDKSDHETSKKIILAIDSLIESPFSEAWKRSYFQLNKNIVTLLFSLADKKVNSNSLLASNEFGNAFAMSNEIAIDSADIKIINNRPYGVKRQVTDKYVSNEATRIFPFKHGFARFIQHGKYGVINTVGKIVLSPAFDYIWDYSEGLFLVRNQYEYYFLDPLDKKHLNLNIFRSVTPFKDGYALVINSDRSKSFIDKSGKALAITINGGYFNEALCHEFTVAEEFGVGKTIVCFGKTSCSLIDTSGRRLYETNRSVDYFSGFNEKGVGIIKFSNSDYAYLFDSSLSEISKQYSDMKPLGGLGFAAFDYLSDSIKNKKDTVSYLFDSDGVLRYSHQGALIVKDYDNNTVICTIEKSGEKLFGVINSQGLVVVGFVFDNIEYISERTVVASVKNDKKVLTFSEQGFLSDETF